MHLNDDSNSRTVESGFVGRGWYSECCVGLLLGASLQGSFVVAAPEREILPEVHCL